MSDYVDKLLERLAVHMKLMTVVMVGVVALAIMMEKNLEDGIQRMNISETYSATRRETTSISNVGRLDGKEGS